MGIGPRAVRDLAGTLRELRQAFVVDTVRVRRPDLAVADDPQPHALVVDQRRLVDLRAREPGDARVLGVDERFRLVALGGLQGLFRELERLHDLTPTWTSRNRAGAAPCETCADWPGWPLPQFVSP